jgi:hypothetical protein
MFCCPAAVPFKKAVTHDWQAVSEDLPQPQNARQVAKVSYSRALV